MRRVGVCLGRIGGAQAQCLVDHAPTGQLVPVHQGDRDPGSAGTAGATDAVDVHLLVFGALIVDHVGNVVDVDAAGGHVGGHQYVDAASAKRLERLLACQLSEITVHGADCETALGQLVGDLLGGPLGAGEDHRRAAVTSLQHPAD
ncbi:Uncharacterised protein [Mycobacterium tuberculosis]|nr:Uncharacterised protein [Mycobacterium tuberculosis]